MCKMNKHWKLAMEAFFGGMPLSVPSASKYPSIPSASNWDTLGLSVLNTGLACCYLTPPTRVISLQVVHQLRANGSKNCGFAG